MTKEEIIKIIKDKKIKNLLLQFSNLAGDPKAESERVEHVKSIFEEGSNFDGSSIEGYNIGLAESDMLLVPDLASFLVLPWRKKATGSFICDVFTPDGKPFMGDPRYILKRARKKAKEMGFEFITAAEDEFFLVKTDNGEVVFRNGHPIPIDKGSYFSIGGDGASDFRDHLLDILVEMGISAKRSHHEAAYGQNEIGLEHGDVLKTADQILYTKTAIQAIAEQFGFFATFMPKPFMDKNGSGMHVHQNLIYCNGGENAFYDKNGQYGLSKEALNFIGGQLKYIKEILAVLACEINSYKRLTRGYEAPTHISWGKKNRSALIRIPSFNEKSARIELRCPDPKCNPYLAFALMLTAGLKGIEENLEPPDPVEEDIFKMTFERRVELSIESLPASLSEALDCFEKSQLAKEALGEHTFNMFLEVKRKECEDFNRAVTNKDYKMSLY